MDIKVCYAYNFAFIVISIIRNLYTYIVDLYSLGITVYEIIYGIQPNESRYRYFKNKIKREWNVKVSNESKHFVSGLIQRNPKKRMTFKQLINHDWFVKKDIYGIFVQ